MKTLIKNLQDVLRYPSAIGGVLIILALVGLSIYTILTIPYAEAIRLWRGGEEVWYQNPQNAQPMWVNWFRAEKLPETIHLTDSDPQVTRTVTQGSDFVNTKVTYAFDYGYEAFPQEISLYFRSQFKVKPPHVSIKWLTPDGREIRVADLTVNQGEVYRLSQDAKLARRVNGLDPEVGLLAADMKAAKPVPLQGRYQVELSYISFEPEATLASELVIYGQVYGWAGTDHLRRDLMIALLWGTPIALAFGLLAALGTTVVTMVIAAAGVWFGSWIDELIQRITEVNLVLPFLPILIMVSTFYSRSIWLLLGVTILLSIFGGGIKTYRATFMQIKEAPYIEAARSYGASSLRIIFLYLTPRIIPLIIPQLVTLIPGYVFLEASLAVLGLGDPVLPTWGKIINDAQTNGALYQGNYYWVLEPSVLLMLTGLAFAMLGFSLDRIFNPRLREM
jgi:peptide/nickel transport system permease protein